MSIPNWTELPFYWYLAIGGGVVILLALVLYFTPVSRLKFPGVFAGVLGGLAAGVGVGVIGMTYFGYSLKQPEAANAPEQQAAGGGGMPPMGPRGMGPMGGRGGQGGGGRGGFGGGGRDNSKNQLASLVAKLDDLTRKPLAVKLTEDQKQKVREQQKELTNEDAKKRLDALLEIVKDQSETLKSAGYRWPDEQGPGRDGQAAPPNPFLEGKNNEHLKSLLGQGGKNQTE
jgi:hypothetical protein